MYTPIYIDFQPIFKPQPIKTLPIDQNDLDTLGKTVLTDFNYILEIEPPRNANSNIGIIEPFEVRLNRLYNYDLKLRLELPVSPLNNKFTYNDCYKVSYYSWYKVLSPLTRQIVLPNTVHKKYLHTEYWYIWDTRKYIEENITFLKDYSYGYWIQYLNLIVNDNMELVKEVKIPYSQNIDLTAYPQIIKIESIKHEGGEIEGYQINDTSLQYIPTFLDIDPLYPFTLELDFSAATNTPVDGTEITISYIEPLNLDNILVNYYNNEY